MNLLIFKYYDVAMHYFPRTNSHSFLRRFGAMLLAVFAVSAANSGAFSAELIMFERSGCLWCKRWDQEVGKIYPLTPEGKLAPLRKVNIDRGVPTEFRLSPQVFYSPTFVLIAGGKEMGRITGYTGDDAFWGLMSRLTKELSP